jgi:hypothetical protein
MAKIPYYEYFSRSVGGIPTPWVNLSVANGSGYFTEPIRIGTWGEKVGIIASSTNTLTVTMQYSHDGVTFIAPGSQNRSEYSTIVKSDAGSLWKETDLGAASWIRLAVGGGGQSSANTFILNRVEEH